MRFYSRTTGTTYLEGIHSEIPEDARPITDERYFSVIANPPPGKIRAHDAEGLPILVDPPPLQPTADELCRSIDLAADAAREAVAGDPLRAVEYERAALEAQTFADAGYQGDVPPMVAAWAINGRTAQQAADSILGEAAQYNAALVQIRALRLSAKELVRKQVAEGHPSLAKAIAEETIADIATAVAGIGNNAG